MISGPKTPAQTTKVKRPESAVISELATALSFIMEGHIMKYAANIPKLTSRLIQSYWRRVTKTDNCWSWIGDIDKRYGYGRVNIKDKKYIASRVAWTIQHGSSPPRNKLVCHTCDNRRCVNPKHLFLGTHKQNSMDAANKRRMCHGAMHHLTTITALAVKQVRLAVSAGAKHRDVAERFNLTRSAVGAIVTGKNWKYAGGPITRRSR